MATSSLPPSAGLFGRDFAPPRKALRFWACAGSIGMDHDFHGIVEVFERIGKSVILHERNAAQADLAIDDSKRDRFQALAFARPGNAQPGVDLEIRAVAAAFEKRSL